ncbi:MAG TPA: ABC transporter ATP-binding protein [Stellaceae bacterium]|nr:ABC transporter ATP-binding protein [Stellaceae bacterium]
MSGLILRLEEVQAYYGESHVLQGVTLALAPGEVLSLLGRNGAGKTTTLKTIMGILTARGGSIEFAGVQIEKLAPFRIARLGIGYVPETRGIFQSLSVKENLTLAARSGNGSGAAWTLERVFGLFPRLLERRESGGGKLSGGEQQMLSIARALLTNPRLLILDEPTEGLAPVVIEEIEAVLVRLKAEGLSILLVEQNLAFALAFADRVAVLGKGRVRWTGSSAEFERAEEVRHRWLGL